MEELFEFANMRAYDFPMLRKKMQEITTEETYKMLDSEYYPDMGEYDSKLLRICNISEEDLIEKSIFKGHPMSNDVLVKDPMTMLYLFIMWSFLKKNDNEGFMRTMLAYSIRQYSNLMKKHIRYLESDLYMKTVDRLPNNHIFRNAIPGVVTTLSNSMEHYADSIWELDIDQIIEFIHSQRMQMSYCIKGFCEVYYQVAEEEGGMVYV